MTARDMIERTRGWCFRFGMIAYKRGMITSEQLKAALLEQVDDDLNEKPHRMLGEILLEKDYMTADQIERVLRDLFKKDEDEERG